MIRYVVRFGTEYPNVNSASGPYDREAQAEYVAVKVLGIESVDDEIISFSQVVRISGDTEEIVNEFEY